MSVGINLLTCTRHPLHRRATEVAVRSLLASDVRRLPCRIVAVDNGSTDDTPAWLATTGIEVISLRENRGIAAARNVGYRRLLDDSTLWAVVEIHNDMVFPSLWLAPLLGVLERYQDVGLASASLVTPRGTLGSPKVPIDYAWPDDRIFSAVETAAAAHRGVWVRPGLQHPVAKRVAMLRQIGLYDEEFVGANFEDTDEVYRAAAAYWRYVVCGASVVWHAYSLSRLDLTDHVGTYRRNYQRFLHKWPDARYFLGMYYNQLDQVYQA